MNETPWLEDYLSAYPKLLASDKVFAAMKQARAAGGNLKLCSLQEDVRSIFEMTRLIKVMAVHSDRQEAVASW